MARKTTTGTVITSVSSGVQVMFTDDKGVTQTKPISLGWGHGYNEGDSITLVKYLGTWDVAGAYEADEEDLKAHWEKGS